MPKKGLSLRENITYSMGSLGREVSNNCINVFFLAYLNVIMQLDALILTVAFVIAKLWDTVNDPMLATWINNTKITKWGRFRPWIAIGALLNAVSLVAMFVPVGFGEVGKYVYYIGMYILWGMTFTVVDVPFWSMIPSIADSTEDRNKLTSLAKLIGGFGGFIISTIGTALVLPLAAPKLGSAKAYLILAFATAILLLTFMSITVFSNKEKYELPSETVGLKKIVGMFKDNSQLVAYAISFVLFVSATTISLFQILYLFIYYGEAGLNILSQSHYGIFTAVACTGQGIAMFFYTLITKKIPREKLYGANYFMAIAGMIGLFFIFFLLGTNKWVNVIIVAIAGAFLMTSNGLNQIGSTVMIADVVDYGEWKTGVRSDSIIFSVQTLLTKLAGAIAMLILGIGIKVAELPAITEYFDVESGKYIQTFISGTGNVTISAMNILRAFMFLVPIPLCIIGYIIYKKYYWLYGEKYDKIKEELEERRAIKAMDIQEQCEIVEETNNECE